MPTERRRRMGLTRQLWLLLWIPIALALGLNALLARQSRHRLLIGEASAELRNHLTFVQTAVEAGLERGHMELLEQRLERLASADRILGIAVFDGEARLILATDQIGEGRPELSAAARSTLTTKTPVEQWLELPTGPALLRTVIVSPRSGQDWVTVVVRDMRYLDALTAAHHRGLLLTAAALLALTAIVVGLVGRATVGKPAGVIVRAAERVASGDLAATVPEEGAEELSRLARSFNAMTASLRDARARAAQEATARLATERKLQHTQALAAAGQVAASIGHEIGSPLNVILGRARRAAEQPDCPEAVRGELVTIAAQSERISRVVARLLAVARPARPAGKGCDLRQVVEETLAFIAPECRERRVQCRHTPPAAAARVGLDADRAFQIVFNLCLNAVQAQRDGGELLVRVLARGAGEGSPKVVLEVEDRGPGVPRELCEHVFEPFFTSKDESGGTGLGLAIVSGIVRDAGGSVEIVPGAQGGACFRVVLPAETGRDRALVGESRA